MKPGAPHPAGEALRAAARLAGGPAALTALYLILRAVFVSMTEHQGLITPSGSVSLGVAFLGLVVLAGRLVVLFILAPLLVYRLTARLLDRRDRDHAAPPGRE